MKQKQAALEDNFAELEDILKQMEQPEIHWNSHFAVSERVEN